MSYQGSWVTIKGVHVFINAGGKITKGPSNLVNTYVSDLVPKKSKNLPTNEQLGVSPTSYTKSSTYRGLVSAISTTRKSLDEVKEKIPKDTKSWYKSKDELSQSEKDIYSILGGSPMKDDVRKLLDRENELKNQLNTASENLKRYEKKVSGSLDIPKSFNKASSKSYNHFQESTRISYYDDKAKEGKAKIVEMTPKQYIQLCAKGFGTSYEAQVRGVNKNAVQFYSELMQQGSKFPMPYINPKTGDQEGRHRAFAAMLNGDEKIPVLLIE